MANLLNRKALVESFTEVKSFLQAGGLHPINRHLGLVLKVKVSLQIFEDSFEVECRDHINNPSYISYSDTFKSFGYHRPVWSAYHIFSFNETSGELSFQVEENNYILKHLS